MESRLLDWGLCWNPITNRLARTVGFCPECSFASRTCLCWDESRTSARIIVGGLAAVAPETAAFSDTECRLCTARLV